MAPPTNPDLTTYLLSKVSYPPYREATSHPFLYQAGDGTLPKPILIHWLYQDRIYAAHAYPRFIGLLIAKIPFATSDLSAFGEGVSVVEERNRKVLECLTFALGNVVREVQFFEKTAAGVDGLGTVGEEVREEREATRNYCSEMVRVASLGTLEEGLVFLWAMEKMYLDSWSLAASQDNQADTYKYHDPLKRLIKNWTSNEFVQFVDDLRTLVDMMDIREGTESWKRAVAVWDRVVELETAFWPDVSMK